MRVLGLRKEKQSFLKDTFLKWPFAKDFVYDVTTDGKVDNVKCIGLPTSIKYKVEREERYLPYIELGRWLCSHFQLETPLKFHKPITQKLYNLHK